MKILTNSLSLVVVDHEKANPPLPNNYVGG